MHLMGFPEAARGFSFITEFLTLKETKKPDKKTLRQTTTVAHIINLVFLSVSMHGGWKNVNKRQLYAVCTFQACSS